MSQLAHTFTWVQYYLALLQEKCQQKMPIISLKMFPIMHGICIIVHSRYKEPVFYIVLIISFNIPLQFMQRIVNTLMYIILFYVMVSFCNISNIARYMYYSAWYTNTENLSLYRTTHFYALQGQYYTWTKENIHWSNMCNTCPFKLCQQNSWWQYKCTQQWITNTVLLYWQWHLPCHVTLDPGLSTVTS